MDNVVPFNRNLVTPREAAESILAQIDDVDELYCIVMINKRPHFILSGDVQGAVLSAVCLQDHCLGLLKGTTE